MKLSEPRTAVSVTDKVIKIIDRVSKEEKKKLSSNYYGYSTEELSKLNKQWSDSNSFIEFLSRYKNMTTDMYVNKIFADLKINVSKKHPFDVAVVTAFLRNSFLFDKRLWDIELQDITESSYRNINSIQSSIEKYPEEAKDNLQLLLSLSNRKLFIVSKLIEKMYSVISNHFDTTLNFIEIENTVSYFTKQEIKENIDNMGDMAADMIFDIQISPFFVDIDKTNHVYKTNDKGFSEVFEELRKIVTKEFSGKKKKKPNSLEENLFLELQSRLKNQ